MSATRTDPTRDRAPALLRRRSGTARSVGRVIASGVLLHSLLIAFPAPLRAQPTDPQIAEARRVFELGKKAEDAGHWEDALHAFQEVGKVRMSPQVRFHIALADENLGHLATALHGFEDAQSMAEKDPENAKDVLENAPEHASDLRGRVPRLKIEVVGQGDVRVLLDGDALAASAVGTEIPVDPGKHSLVLEVTTANGTSSMPAKEVTAREHNVERVVLKVPVEKVEAGPVVPIEKPKPAETRPGTKIPAIVAGSVGIAGLIGAGVFLGLRQSAISQVRDSCKDKVNDRNCDPKLAAVASNGKTDTYVATSLALVGVAGLATGAVLWFTVGKDKPAQSATRVTVRPGYFSVDGRF